MKNNKRYLGFAIGFIAFVIGVVLAKQFIKPHDKVTVVEEEKIELPVNVIPVTERPFVTLTPDASGRYLSLGINDLKTEEGTLEYELVYDTIEGEQGAFGRINLKTETQPISKSLLLGSKSAGGAVTYYPGVSGGSIALTWGETKVKESFSFLRFNPTDPIVTTQDGRLTYTMTSKALKKDDVVVMMKTSGYGVVPQSNVIAGPYAVLTPTVPKGAVTVSIKLPAGDHLNPTIYEQNKGVWTKLKTTLKEDVVTATPTSNTFIVVTE